MTFWDAEREWAFRHSTVTSWQFEQLTSHEIYLRKRRIPSQYQWFEPRSVLENILFTKHIGSLFDILHITLPKHNILDWILIEHVGCYLNFVSYELNLQPRKSYSFEIIQVWRSQILDLSSIASEMCIEREPSRGFPETMDWSRLSLRIGCFMWYYQLWATIRYTE